jgi:integrase
MNKPVAKQTPERIGPGLYRRGDTIFARVTVEGRRTFRSTGTNDPATARRILKEWRKQQVLREHGVELPQAALERNRLTVAEVLADYEAAGFPDRHNRAKSPATQQLERKCLARLRAYRWPVAVAITLKDCDEYRQWRASGGYVWQRGIVRGKNRKPVLDANGKPKLKERRSKAGTKTVDLELQTLSNALALAVRRGKLKVNPLAGRKPYHREQDTVHCRECAPTPSELRLIEHALRLRGQNTVADCVMFLACSGLRVREALPLDWEAVDWRNGVIHVAREKRGCNPFVPLLPELEQLLRGMQARATSGLLFPSPLAPEQPLAYPTIAGILSRTVRGLGLRRITLHGLRSYYVTRCREAGLPDAEIAMLIGDRSGPAIIARTYGDVLPQHLFAQARRVRLLATAQPVPS